MTKYEPTIGLEIHVRADTETKMFCNCLNDPDERHPNINVCPICLGHPGTLPVSNRKAIESVIKLGQALNGDIAESSHFDRKSYFYPDLPKGYQISQKENPLVEGGELTGVKITRIHLEEDAGALSHTESKDYSLVNFNRAGVPLIELVTEPDIKSADEAVKFAREFQLILRYLGISSADIEKGQMRVEVNISLRPQLTNDKVAIHRNFGTKVEIKNIASFKMVRGSIEYEIKRQEKLLEKGEKVIQETRGWDDNEQKTISQRSKESAHDYRYFPEPDLPPINLREFDLEALRTELPELPKEKRERFKKEFKLDDNAVELLVEDKSGASYFEEAVSELKSMMPDTNYQILFNYFSSDLRGLMNERRGMFQDLRITPEHFAHIVSLVMKKELSSRMAKDLLIKMFETGEDPETLKREGGLELISDEEGLKKIAEEVVSDNLKAAEDYKKGKENALQFLVGQVMAKTKGQAEPEKAREVLKKLLV